MCLFCKIVAGEIPSRPVYEDDRFLAFLNIRPIRDGHVLLIPKAHAEDVLAADDETVAAAFVAAKRVAETLKRAYGVPRVAVLAVGLEIPHLHIHLVPVASSGDVDFARAAEASSDALDATLAKICHS